MKPLLHLCMMLKDEAGSIKAVLEAVKPFVDRWTIVDTGSSDGTPEIVKEVMGDFPGELLHEPFKGYAVTRNRVLELAGDKCEFTLMLSGDEFIRDGEKFRELLETQRKVPIVDGKPVDCYFLSIALDDGMSRQARVLRTGTPWKYDDFGIGVHEVPVHPDGAPSGFISRGYVEHIVTNPMDRVNTIWLDHVPKLRAALEKNPDDARALEFLAQSLETVAACGAEEEEPGERMALLVECHAAYLRRFALPFVNQNQKHFFMRRFIEVCRMLGDNVYSKQELFGMADKLREEDPGHPEHWYMRAALAAQMEGMKVSYIYDLAREATEVAAKVREQGGFKNSIPLDLSVEWRAHRLAAIAAMNIAKKHPDKPECVQVVRDHVNAGLQVGGQWKFFKGILEELKAPTQTP